MATVGHGAPTQSYLKPRITPPCRLLIAFVLSLAGAAKACMRLATDSRRGVALSLELGVTRLSRMKRPVQLLVVTITPAARAVARKVTVPAAVHLGEDSPIDHEFSSGNERAVVAS